MLYFVLTLLWSNTERELKIRIRHATITIQSLIVNVGSRVLQLKYQGLMAVQKFSRRSNTTNPVITTFQNIHFCILKEIGSFQELT